jgi:glycosyltransferase involved in cell wall biosynthesis
MTTPRIEVLIPTRNRPGDLDRCLSSLAAVEYADWGLIIVDQSTSKESAEVVERWRSKIPKITHVAMAETGISRARNAALERSTAPILAFVDDDCTVPANWLTMLEAAFEKRPQAELVLGRVTGCAYDAREALLPVFEPRDERADPWTIRAMGAAMYLRRSLFERLGAFDEMLGVGSGTYESGEDTDYRYRALAGGIEVAVAPEVVVVHHGLRPYANGSARKLMKNTAFARGATDMKLWRLGQGTARRVIWSALSSYWREVRIPWPLAYYGLGLVSSFRYGVDRMRGLYRR